VALLSFGEADAADEGDADEAAEGDADEAEVTPAEVIAPTAADLKRIEAELNPGKTKKKAGYKVAVYGGDDRRLRQQTKFDRRRIDVDFYASAKHDAKSRERLAYALKRRSYRHVVIMTGWAAHESTRHLKNVAKLAGATVQLAPTQVGASWLTSHLEEVGT